ncbi:hypothetical protein, partial [Acetobacter cerevisiae]
PVLEQDGSLTLAGSLQVQGKTLVQNVDDWTAYQAVGAKDADARYVQKASGANDYPALSAGVQKSSGSPWFSYVDAAGTTQWTFFQPAGDYATNPALQAETQRATTIESNLQSSKANLAGGNQFSGDQTVGGSVIAGMGIGWSGGTSFGQGRWTNGHLAFGAPANSGNTYTGYFQVTDLLGSPGDNYSGINMFGLDYSGQRHDWLFPWNGNIQTPKGFVAFQSDLPTSGTINGGYYTRVGNVLQQHFTVGSVVHVENGFWVSFPIAYSQTPKAIQLTANTAGDMDVAWYNASTTGFFIMIPYNSITSNQPVSVLVTGIA